MQYLFHGNGTSTWAHADFCICHEGIKENWGYLAGGCFDPTHDALLVSAMVDEVCSGQASAIDRELVYHYGELCGRGEFCFVAQVSGQAHIAKFILSSSTYLFKTPLLCSV